MPERIDIRDIKDMKLRNITIPEPMYDSIVELIEEYPAYGFESVEEFVRESIRRNLEDY